MDRQMDFIDLLSVASFVIALENLDMNITQEDMAEASAKIDRSVKKEIENVHEHLAIQDAKLNLIISTLERMERNDS